MAQSILDRILAAIRDGALRRETTRRFKISQASTVCWDEAFVQDGRHRAGPMGRDQRSQAIKTQTNLIRQTDEAQLNYF